MWSPADVAYLYAHAQEARERARALAEYAREARSVAQYLARTPAPVAARPWKAGGSDLDARTTNAESFACDYLPRRGDDLGRGAPAA